MEENSKTGRIQLNIYMDRVIAKNDRVHLIMRMEGFEPPHPLTGTWPSTMRVCQFRHIRVGGMLCPRIYKRTNHFGYIITNRHPSFNRSESRS